MKRTLQIVIESGEKTCAPEPGKFCPRLITKKFGTRFQCEVFRPGFELKNSEKNGTGWLLRWSECIEAEVKDGNKGTS